ncbi:MAG: hypothetical protein A2X94_09295 [Bdellovibrionales bacterium GWB1_55_8]|nr:MAG: hypothetical protein A2X94_09295 [Bdellovibrionales bacterium GWB1_55_8]
MRGSVFSTLVAYLKDVLWALRSVWGSCLTAVPYLFGSGDLHREVTELYPDPISSKTPDDLPAKSRGFLFNDIDRCSGCRECEKICPARCIRIEAEPAADESKIWISVFDVDFSKCVFCGICVEVCGPNSLRHTREFEGASYSNNEMVTRFGRGWVSPEQRKKWAAMRRQIEEEDGVRS